MISELENSIQPYAWGSRHALAELRGEAGPSATPEAELWMGAHPLAPSRLVATAETLPSAILAAPTEQLGADVVTKFGPKLPFLLKVLAAGTPLSLQAHPSLEQAEQGFLSDEAAGIPLDAPHRNYKDQNHKPELICALGEFWALCGFRRVDQTLELLDELAVPELLPYRAMLAHEPTSAGISKAFSALMQADASARQRLAEVTTAACRDQASGARFEPELRWAARLGELYPGDVGVVVALLLNLLHLAEGEAIYLPAGNLHAYLGGTGVEIMASSDNVLRGGLTPKHVNVAELLRVLDFSPLDVEPLRPTRREHEWTYLTPAREFQLSYLDLTPDLPAVEVEVKGPEIWLVLRGAFTLSATNTAAVTLAPARSAFVSANTGRLQLRGSGRIFRATVSISGS